MYAVAFDIFNSDISKLYQGVGIIRYGKTGIYVDSDVVDVKGCVNIKGRFGLVGSAFPRCNPCATKNGKQLKTTNSKRKISPAPLILMCFFISER